jgi:DNA-binding transcriptional MerR regulator
MNQSSSNIQLELVESVLNPENPLDRELAESPSQEGLMTIGAMAKLCNVTVRTLRYYEEVDLIGPAKRTTGKYRLYNQRTVKRVKAILALQDLNYTLDEIVATLGSYSQTTTFTKEEQIRATRVSLEMQKQVIESKLKALMEMKTDVEMRLHVLDSACSPCFTEDATQHCHDACSNRDVHIN